ncbi:hypothetical protein AOQ84DRAFT_31497 [Glonium stellatum]|uniref:Uncharacterized protein n=1 Tax=Glonium stellatum TaxID=574774 RepID=A0A8E2JTI4_9PEZI|nr:hypothetical protein AOQ84DRAFT_31497 [Glonium stellatum]
MAAQMNGRAKKANKMEPNGHVTPKMNGQVSRPAKRYRRRRRIMQRSFSISARAVLWSLLITVIFWCPSSIFELSQDSPRVCKPYLNARSYAAPYLDPYYEAYLAPQVDKIRPYVNSINKNIYTPVAVFTKEQYSTYGAHRVEQAQEYVQNEWNKAIRPQLDVAQAKAKAQYDHYLAPQVQQASNVVVPYYQKTKASSLDKYQHTLLPAYQAVLPYAQKGYAQGHHITVHIIFPFIRSVKDSSFTFLSRTLWPQVRILYGDNVEPQLVRIRERLGRYKDGKKLEATAEAVEASLSIESASSKFLSVSSVASTVAQSIDSVNTATPAQPPKETWDDTEIRERIKNDLRTWQGKFAAAADKGAEDLDERVKEITSRQIDSQAHGVGSALIVQLEETSKSSIDELKSTIKQTVKNIPEDVTEDELESAYEKIVAAVRAVGMTIRDKAQAVRSWKQTYDEETDYLVKSAVESTVAVLDNIQDLGLQEVGMRWAWMEGVTYKDWAKYHELRHTLEEWRNEVKEVGARHEGLRKAHEEGNKVEDKAMAIAAEAAKELARLKDVARWKLWANDSTDDFSNKKVPARTFKAAQAVVGSVEEAASKVSGSILGSETPATESVASVAKDKVKAASSKLSESIIGAEPNAAEKVATAISEAVIGSQATTDSLSSVASSKVKDASSVGQSVVSAAKNKKDQVKEAIIGTPAPPHESVLSEASSSLASAASAASKAPKKVWGGAMAQKVEAKHIIYDDIIDDSDDMSYSEKIQSAVSEAGDRAAQLTKAISEALLKPTSTQGTMESVTSLASEQYERAMSAASSVLYGTEQGTVESMASVASDKYVQAVTAASYAIYGTPTPVLQSMQTEASSRYADAVSMAQEQYSIAKSRISEMVSGTPKPVHEEMFSSVERAYSGSLAAASEKLQAALHYTNTIKSYVSGPTQGVLESVSSIAASRLSEGLSLASAQYTNAKIAVGAQPTPAHQRYMAEAQRRYYEGIGLAHARYSEFIDAASSAVYGTPTPAYQSFMSVAQSQYSAALAAASSNMDNALSAANSAVGKTSKSPTQSLIDSASSQYEAAVSAASASLSAASSKASEAIYGTQQGTIESLASVASASAAYAVSEASSSIIGSETPWVESVASQASQNWDSLISRASEQVYGAPTPFTESAYSQVGEYGAQATDAVASQYAAVQALISDLVIGREPDFTESVMLRLSSAYYTGYPAMASSASSYAAEAYATASSIVSSAFTPPATIEAILNSVTEQLNAAVEAASIQAYGTQKGAVDQATEAAASAYASVHSRASEAIYGTRPGYAERAQASVADVAASAQSAVSAAIYGSPTGAVEAAASGAAGVYSSVASAASEKAAGVVSVAGEGYEAARARVSEAVYGPEQGAVESASSRIAAAVESARSRLAEMYERSGEAVGETYERAREGVEEFASSVSSAAGKATGRVRDEL